MKKTIFLLFILLLKPMSMVAQNPILIDTMIFDCFNKTKDIDKIAGYKIVNNSDEEYLTWISLNPLYDKTNDVLLINDYFFSNKGDFSYFSLMTDGLLNSVVSIDQVGYTFLKKLSKGESFTFYIIKTTTPRISYEDKIVIMKRNVVEEYIQMKLEEQYFSKLLSVILIE